MKIGVVAESTMEREALSANLAPTPLLETQVAFTTARAIMAAAELGIFEALGTGEKTADEVAASCRTDRKATLQLLNCLVGIGYARWQDRKYGMIEAHRKWLLRKSPSSIVDKLAFQALEWDLVGKLEEFVRTGTPLDFHGRMTAGQWRIYQDAMRDVSAGPAFELAQHLAIPPDATRLLDIGGSHGLYSIELCRRYPTLNATILELPGAVDRASQIAAREGMGERVRHRLGNALTDDLGEGTFDVVIINNLVHHFTMEQNGELARRVARALVGGGVYAIGDFSAQARPARAAACLR